MSLALELPDDFLNAVAAGVAERLEERRRWAEIDGCASYLGCTVRRVYDLRERGLPAKKIGGRLLFDLREVDRWLEEQA